MYERRFTTEHAGCGVEERADAAPLITGYAAVYYREDTPGTEFELLPGLFERIAPGAFDRASRSDDVRALVNHDFNQVLGRSGAGTLKLSVDDKGLHYRIDPPDTVAGRDVVTSIKRGDMIGSSFGFMVDADGVEWDTEERDGVSYDIRLITSVRRLVDVGPVTFAAYTGTSTGARGLLANDADAISKEYDAYKERRQAERDRVNFRAAKVKNGF